MSLEVVSLSVELGGTPIISDVSLAVADGERVAVMGPSGAGKSTLLRAIAGLVDTSTGRVLLDGQDHTTTPPHERSMGLMFQDYALFPHLDVARNVGYGLRMAGVPRDARHRRVAEMLDLVGLREHADRSVDALSGGEQQRVALARTLAPDPAAALFDEPLGSLDQALKDDLLAQMRTIVDRLGIPALYVTHDRLEAEAFADRLAIMRDGRLLRVDTPEGLWRDPGTEFVARLMGHRTIIDGSAIGGTGRLVVSDSAVSIDAAGPITGTTMTSEFRDGRYRISLDVAGQRLWLWTDAAVPTGREVSVSIAPDGVAELVDEVGGPDDPTEFLVDGE